MIGPLASTIDSNVFKNSLAAYNTRDSCPWRQSKALKVLHLVIVVDPLAGYRIDVPAPSLRHLSLELLVREVPVTLAKQLVQIRLSSAEKKQGCVLNTNIPLIGSTSNIRDNKPECDVPDSVFDSLH